MCQQSSRLVQREPVGSCPCEQGEHPQARPSLASAEAHPAAPPLGFHTHLHRYLVTEPFSWLPVPVLQLAVPFAVFIFLLRLLP